MAKIATFEGLHWFFLGWFRTEEKAWKQAKKYACVNLRGAETQVKQVVTKVDWIKNTDIRYIRSGSKRLVELNELS